MTATTTQDKVETLAAMGRAMCKAARANGVTINEAWIREVVQSDRLMLLSQCQVTTTREDVDAAVASIAAWLDRVTGVSLQKEG